MAYKTAATLQAKIEALQAERDELVRRERDGVITRIQEAMAVYSITPAELARKPKAAPAPEAEEAPQEQPEVEPGPSRRPGPQPPKYRDPESGKTWTGMGRWPGWMRAYVDGGGDPSNLLIKASRVRTRPTAKQRNGNPGGAGKKRAPKYRDGENTWTGAGGERSMPGWLKAHVDAGRDIEEFRVKSE